MTRKEHLDWCKKRALKYLLEKNSKNSLVPCATKKDLQNAWNSIISDLDKHSETAEHSAIQLGEMLIMSGHLSTAQEMAKFIDDFN